MPPACSSEIIQTGTWNEGAWAEQGRVERLNQGTEVPCSHLPFVLGKNHQSPETFHSLPALVGFVLLIFHKFNNLY